MYTEKSVELKSDFYSRYGESHGRLYYEKSGLPCVILGGGEEFMAFSLDCGVRAYGRDYGDVLKICDSDSNVCDIHFASRGKGAQILYRRDIFGIREMDEVVSHTVNKLLRKIGCNERMPADDGYCAVCDRYGADGWCAVKLHGQFKSVPLPLGGYNVILIRTRKQRLVFECDEFEHFRYGDRERIRLSTESLKECRLDAFFDMINKSELSMEHMLNPSDEILSVIKSAQDTDGVCACRITDIGVVAFCRKEMTDVALRGIINQCSRRLGYAVRVAVVK